MNNATSGLHLAATALNVKPGDKGDCHSDDLCRQCNCIRYCGGEVVFCDIDKDTYLMDVRKLEAMLKAVPKGTYKGIVLVDFAGYPFGFGKFRKLADKLMVYGLLKMPAMLPVVILLIAKAKNNIAETVALLTVRFSLFIR